jgi:iron complex outermembrane recepter protein
MIRPVFRPAPLALAIALAIGCPAIHAQSADTLLNAPVQLDIAAQPLGQALNDWARQTRIELIVPPALVAGKTVSAVTGKLTPRQALDQLLASSGLIATAEDHAIVIKATPTTQGTSTLPAVTVVANTEPESATGPITGYVAKRSVTGTKTDTPIIEVPQSISVITADELDDKGITTLSSALEQTAGVTVNPYGFDSRALDWVMLRGFDGWYTSSYRDGLIQNVGLTFLGVQTEVYGLERIEVMRGPSSVLFGKGDVGGVVNRVSKLPNANATREIVVQVGSYGRTEVAVDMGGTLGSDELQYRLVGVGLDTGTQESYSNGTRMDQKRQYLAPSLTWKPTSQTTLTLQMEHLRDDSSDDVQYVTGADGLPTNVKEGDPNFSRIKTNSDAIGYQLDHTFDSGWTLRNKLRTAYRSMDKHHIVSWLDSTGTTLLRRARHDVESVRETAMDTSVSKTIQSGSMQHALLFGVDIDHTRAQWSRWQNMTTSLDMSNPIYGISIAEPVTQVADTQFTSTQIGVYAQDQIKLDERWGLTLGLRHDQVKSETDDRFNTSQSNQTDSATTGRVGLTYKLTADWVPYASYAESFVPNVGIDAAGNAFVPSDGKQVELGMKYMPEGSATSFTAAVFNLEKTNVVTYDSQTYEARQIGKVRSRGLELEMKSAIAPRWQLTSSFTALNMKVLASANSSEVGHMPILTPTQTASLWLDYKFAAPVPGLSVGAGLRHVGKRWNDASNTSSEPAYTLLDAAFRYDTGPWRFAVNVTNLLNKHYYSGQAYGIYYRGAERNVLLTIKYRF